MEISQIELNILLRVLLIAVLAGVLGWERESAGKSAGIRTYILVGISAVLFVSIGDFMIERFRPYGDLMRFDPAALVGAVVTGISFLGAGMIFFQGKDNRVKGLTTAAGILTTAAIGMLVGVQKYFLAIGSTIVVFAVLHFLDLFEKKYLAKGKEAGTAEDHTGV
jgi:putative Mg2+ transporter-C (MgtC) family protein